MAKRGNNEGSIFRRADGRWAASLHIGYEHGQRRRKTFYGHTQREVQAQLVEARRALQQGLPLGSDREQVGPFLRRWLEDVCRHTVRPTTYDGYERLLRVHVIPSIGRITIRKLTGQHLASLYSEMLKRGLAPRTVQYAHAVLHRALEQAMRWNLIARNPVDLVDPPRPRREEIKPLTLEQAQALLKAAECDELHALYVVALTTGLRLGELFGLKWADVSWATSEIHVRRQVGRSSAGMLFSEPKTARGRRTVALPQFAIDALRSHRARQVDGRRATSGREELDLVFPNAKGRPYERQNLVRRSFKPILLRAGLPPIRFHDLRHTAATLLLSLGEHPKVVQERLGHANIAVTMDIYSHVMPQMQRGAAAKLDGMFAEPIAAV